ncbi:MAG TPA: lipoate--protein ligase family protein [Caldithrix abyssi]|uniref:lipoate--protein ligase n=1 Tax=Caldithrix abyssi TaxID=187145 RepID=A0A7V1LLR5_CALAY|nr:lipoate--protein ligase family protein [Caldithrix abyssi]
MHVRLLDMGMVSVLRSQSIYHGITESMTADSEPAISIMRPEAPYVSTGYFQEVNKEVDTEYCRDNRIPVIRRHVGGGAVLLDQNQLFFHLMLPSARAREFGLPRALEARFETLAKPVILAYHKLSVNASFRPINDIHVNGKKIGGTGVGEIEEGIVFAGSMMFDFDTELMARVLRLPDEKMRDKVRAGLNDYMTTMKKELDVLPKLEDVAEALLSSFEEIFNITLVPSMPTLEEMDKIYEWDERLRSDSWMNSIQLAEKDLKHVKISSNVKILQAAHKARGGLIRGTLRVVDGVVDDVCISGDFPMSPQNCLKEFAHTFQGARLDRSELEKRLHKALAELEVDMAGVDENDFKQLFEQVTP